MIEIHIVAPLDDIWADEESARNMTDTEIVDLVKEDPTFLWENAEFKVKHIEPQQAPTNTIFLAIGASGGTEQWQSLLSNWLWLMDNARSLAEWADSYDAMASFIDNQRTAQPMKDLLKLADRLYPFIR